jgi:hypothetical protein
MQWSLAVKTTWREDLALYPVILTKYIFLVLEIFFVDLVKVL